MSTAGPALGLTWMQGHPEARHKQLDMNNVVHDPAGDDCPPEVVQRLKAPAQGNTQVTRNGTIKRLPRSQQGGTDWASVTLGKRAVGNNPEHHLWSEASRAAGARRRRCNTALMHQGTAVDVLPLPSPVRRSEWWRRPPSPLVWYMRPLWAVPFEEERESPERRAPEDGEQPRKPSLIEQMSGESCTPLGSALSLLSQEMTFFAREQARARRGSWSSSLLESLSPSLPPTAPPPPTTNAPTIPVAMSAGAERRRQLQLQQQQQQQPQSPDGSPESTRPPTGRRTPSASSSMPDSAALLMASAFAQPKDQYQLSYLKQQPQQQQQGFPPARSPEGGGDTTISRSRLGSGGGGDRGSVPHPTTFLNSYAVNNSGKGVVARPKAVALLARRRSLELRLAENAGPPERVNSSRVVLHRSASVGDIKHVKTEGRATLRRTTSTARYSYPQPGDITAQQNRAVQFALPELRGDVAIAASKGSKVEEKVTGIRVLDGKGTTADKGNGSRQRVGEKDCTLGHSQPDDGDEAPAWDKPAGDPEDHVGKLKLDDDGHDGVGDNDDDDDDDGGDNNHQRRNSVGLVGVAYARSPAMMAPPPPRTEKGTSGGGAGTRKHSRRASVAVSHKYHQYEHGLAFLSDGSSEAPSMGLVSGGTTPTFAASVAAAAASVAEMGAATEDSSEQTFSAPESSPREDDEADEGTEVSPSSSAVDSNVGSTARAPSRQESSVYNPVSPSSLHGIQRSGSFHTPTPSRRRKKVGADVTGSSPGQTGGASKRRGAPARKLSRGASGRRIKTKERRTGKGTAASRGDALGNSSQQSSKRRGSAPSAESPFNVGSPSVRVGSRRRSKAGRGSPGFAGGFVPAFSDGVGADGTLDGSKPRSIVSRDLDGRNIAPGPSRSGSGRVGGGSGGLAGSRSSISRREPSGKGLEGDEIDRLAGKADEGVEGVVRHYVNPMKVQGEHRKQMFSPTLSSNRISRGSSTRAEGGDDLGTSKGAFSKLLRRLSILRRRWRHTRRQKEASKGLYGNSLKGKRGGDGVDKFDAAVETFRGGKGKGTKDVRSLTDIGDPEEMTVDKGELEMACRRLLDGLWMSAKRGSGTVSLSVADGRTLLLGLMTPGGPAERAGISFGVPLSRPGSASRPSSGSCKPSRPILGGGGGPFVRAARSNNTAGDAVKPRLGAQANRRNAELGLSPQWQHEQLVTLQRAMETAMGVATDGGVSSETESFSEQTDFKDYAGEWSTGSQQQQQPPDPSASRRHGRHTSSRANLHRKMGSVFTGNPLGIMGPGSRRLEGGSGELVGPGRDPGRRESARSQSLPPKDTSDSGMDDGGFISAGGERGRGAEDGRRREAQYHSERQHRRRRSSLPKHVDGGTTPSYEDLKREAGGRSSRGRKAERSRDSSHDGVRERSQTS